MGITQSKRISNYLGQNNTGVWSATEGRDLTPRQQRRLRKKGNALLKPQKVVEWSPTLDGPLPLEKHDHSQCVGFEVHGDL
jgi:hypothetical protein